VSDLTVWMTQAPFVLRIVKVAVPVWGGALPIFGVERKVSEAVTVAVWPSAEMTTRES
jgi:hypothetical protein